MRILGYILGLALSTTGAAQAQDWDGWYAGLGLDRGGYSFSIPTSTRIYEVNGNPQSVPDESADGTGAAVIFGRMWQRDKIVYGLELDLGGVDAGFKARDTDPTDPSSYCSPVPCADIGLRTVLDTKGHFRAMVGLVTSDKAMLFGALGVAKASFSSPGYYFYYAQNGQGHELLVPGGWFDEKIVYGPSLGVGTQFRLGARTSLRAEVLHDMYRLHYDSKTSISVSLPSPSEDVRNIYVTGSDETGTDFDISSTSARLSLIFQF